MKTQAIPTAERVRAFREQRAQSGLIRFEVWIHHGATDEQRERIRRYAKRVTTPPKGG